MDSSARMLPSSALRSSMVEPSISSEVARGSGASSVVSVTLRPSPTTITALGDATSARMPASLPSPTRTSLGHLSPGVIPVVATTASTAATPVSSGSQPHAADGTAEASTPSENVIWDRGGADQFRPCRPRPAVWCSAMRTMPAISSPAACRASRSAFVEPVDSTTSRWRNGRPVPTRSRRIPSTSSGARAVMAASLGSVAAPVR